MSQSYRKSDICNCENFQETVVSKFIEERSHTAYTFPNISHYSTLTWVEDDGKGENNIFVLFD